MSQKYNAGPVRGTGLSLSYAVVQHGPNVRAAHGDDDGVRLRLLHHDRPAAGLGVPVPVGVTSARRERTTIR